MPHPWCRHAAAASPFPAVLGGFTCWASSCFSLAIPPHRTGLFGLFQHTLFLQGIVSLRAPMEIFISVSYMTHKHIRKRPCPKELTVQIVKPEEGPDSLANATAT